MKLEGSLSGTGLDEFRAQWKLVDATLGKRKLRIDLCGVTYIDPVVQALLDEIQTKAHPEFETSSLLTQHFVEQARQRHTKTKSVQKKS